MQEQLQQVQLLQAFMHQQAFGGGGGNKPYPVQQYMQSPHSMPTTLAGLQGITQQIGVPLPRAAEAMVTSIHEAVAFMRPDAIEVMLQKNPALANEKGFNQQAPLHRAALRGDTEVLELLLRYGADPNACNAFDERPIHFACKRGSPRILHLLVDNGANVNAVDKAGKGAIHHAAQGGSVLTMHYLVEECGATTKTVDRNLCSLLHVACSHGNADVFQYLMKKERCDVHARDIGGNNCLHIAAQAGNSWICWELLCSGGLGLIHDSNNEGATPLDLAMKGHHFKHKEVARLLGFYAKKQEQTGKAVGPLLGWYIHLVLPLMVYPGVLAMACSVPAWTGWVALAGMIGMLSMMYQHQHRMKHVSRWPNPIQMGMFAAGLYHTTICYFWNIFPSVYQDRPNFAVMSVLLALLMNYMYIKLLTRDPGAATESAEKDRGGYYTVRDIALGSARPEAFCPECEIIPPRRTHHCRLCMKCYLDCDHHCLFLYRCIAKHNHRLFVLFIVIVMTCMMLYEYIAVAYLQREYPTGSFDSDFMAMVFYGKPWVWTTILANGVAWIWGIVLLRYQLLVISKGHLTAYQPNLGRSNLNRYQRMRNVLHFFMGRRPFAVDMPMTV